MCVYVCVYVREIHIAKVVESSKECNEGGRAGNVAQKGTAANKRKREGDREGR